MLRPRRAAPVALALLLACGGPTPSQTPDTKDVAPDAAAPAAPSASAAPSAAAAAPKDAGAGDRSQAPASEALPQPGPPVLTLLDPGAEPRKPLRYVFQKKNETVELDMKMSMAMTAGGRASPNMAMPTIRVTMDIKPTAVDADGTVTAAVETRKVDVLKDNPLPKDLQEKLVKDMAAIVGIKGKTVVTSRGLTKEAALDAPASAPPQVKQILDSMKDSLRDMSMPLPEEAVGKNAKWEVKTVLAAQLTSVQRTTYVAKDIADKSVVLDATVVQTAAPQSVATPPNMPPGATLHLDSHEAAGSGKVKLALDRFTPTSTMKIASKSVMTVTMGNEKQALGTDVTMEMSVKPAGAK